MSGRPGSNVIRTCILCGTEFHPTSTRQKCCNKIITVPCIICGKPMEQICTTKAQPKTCSRACTIKLGDIGREKAAHKLTRICKYCGKAFTPKSVRDEYCNGPHYATCEVCGKQFLVTGRYNHINKTCSDACSYISAKRNTDMSTMVQHLKETMLEKYGVENAVFVPEILKKVKQTTLDRYGAEYYTQTTEYRNKIRNTNLKKYGSEHHLSSPEVIEKRRQTVFNRYGVDNVFQSEKIKSKSQNTVKDKFGVDFVSQSPEIHSRMSKNRKNNVAKDGKRFDSRYERQFYDFLLNIPNLNIETQVPIPYVYQGKPHTTLIDFRIDGILFEVKGVHLLSGVYDSVGIPIAAKLQTYEEHNVILITNDTPNAREIINQYSNLIGIDKSIFDNRLLLKKKEILWQQILLAIQKRTKFIDKSLSDKLQ